MKLKILALLFLTIFISCIGNSDNNSYESRAFKMGFTPWPYEATYEAVNWTYEKIYSDGDIISHHMEEGVPWQESFDGEIFPESFMNEISSRMEKHQDFNKNHKVVLQLNPIDITRNTIAQNRGENESSNSISSWNEKKLDSPEVKIAYTNYVIRMIEIFRPDYLISGVEVNLLLRNNPELWDQYLELHKEVYSNVKKQFPELLIGTSIFSVPLFPEWSPEDSLDSQLDGLKQIELYSDFIAFSVHPFLSSLMANEFPDNYFTRLFNMTDKPVAISESSYPAQEWQVENSDKLIFNGTEKKQLDFTDKMLKTSNENRALFVIWFCLRDYDTLWEETLNRDPVGLLWRDTGLYDENGIPRKAYTIWNKWFRASYISS